MSEQRVTSRPVHENLDTAYVNLAALIRYLREREFTGSVHVELDEYAADVFLVATEAPRVRETDYATNRQAEGEAAMQRLLVRAREPGGLVSVYAGDPGEREEVEHFAPGGTGAVGADEGEGASRSPEEAELSDLARLSGELIATIERAALSAGADFAGIFRAVRLGLADDFSFLDPATARFEYSNGVVRLRAARPAPAAYVSGITEALRRVVNKISTGPRAASVRERVALELAVLARRRQSQLARFKFTPQLDRIAGTRVL